MASQRSTFALNSDDLHREWMQNWLRWENSTDPANLLKVKSGTLAKELAGVRCTMPNDAAKRLEIVLLLTTGYQPDEEADCATGRLIQSVIRHLRQH